MSGLSGLPAPTRFIVILTFILIGICPKSVHAQSYVEGISEVLNSTTSTDLYTKTNTFITYDLAAYYSPYTAAQLLDNGTQIAYNETPSYDGINAELDGHVPNLRTGDDYEIDGAHFLDELYIFYDPGTGNTYYENPGAYGFIDGYQSSGYDYYGGGGEYYTIEDSVFLGYTADAISTAVPQIAGTTPPGAARGTSGQITISGSHLVDVFNGGTTPSVLSGSGLSLSVAGSPSATQVILNFQIDANAPTGSRQFTLSNRFGPSEPQTFTVGDPSPIVNDVEPHIWPAGTTTPLTITGSGFGIAPTIALGGVGVLNPSPTITSSTDNQISTTVAIAVDAPDGPATVIVQSHGSGGNGFVQGIPGQSSSGSNVANISAAPAPTPQIMFNGNNISGTTQSVMAGQLIALSVSAPSGFTITSQAWSFQNQTAISGGFKNNNETGPPSASSGGKEASDPALNQSSLNYFYVNPGSSETVSYQYTLDNGRSASATATFNIDGPTGVNASTYPQSNTTAPVVILPGATVSSMSLGFGPSNVRTAADLGDLGVVFHATAQHLPSQGGTFLWVQELRTAHLQLRSTQTLDCRPKNWNGTSQLDATYPFSSGPTNDNTVGLSGVYTYDSPTIGLLPESAEQFGARLYLMWDPSIPRSGETSCQPAHVLAGTNTGVDSTCSSIPIPLGYIDWSWTGDAIDTKSTSAGDTFTMSNGTSFRSSGHLSCSSHTAGSFVQDSTFPEWQNTVLSGTSVGNAYTCNVQP